MSPAVQGWKAVLRAAQVCSSPWSALEVLHHEGSSARHLCSPPNAFSRAYDFVAPLATQKEARVAKFSKT